ncbi:unnamed protein product, partial [Schistosoma mattheei]
SVDFSDSLNALVCSTDRGRIEVIAESVEKRKCDPSRPRYIPEVRLLKKIPIFFYFKFTCGDTCEYISTYILIYK